MILNELRVSLESKGIHLNCLHLPLQNFALQYQVGAFYVVPCCIRSWHLFSIWRHAQWILSCWNWRKMYCYHFWRLEQTPTHLLLGHGAPVQELVWHWQLEPLPAIQKLRVMNSDVANNLSDKIPFWAMQSWGSHLQQKPWLGDRNRPWVGQIQYYFPNG